MNAIVWLAIGGLIGWVASMVMSTSDRRGIMLNVSVGIVGALLGGWVLSGPFGTSTINEGNFSVGGVPVSFLGAVIVSFLGAVILLALVKLVRGTATP